MHPEPRPELRPVTITVASLIGGEETNTYAGIYEAAQALQLCRECRQSLDTAYALERRWIPPDTECQVPDGDPCWGWRVLEIEY